MAVCLNMQTKQRWGAKLVYGTADGLELQKQSAQHNIPITITIHQICMVVCISSVLSKAIYICMYMFTIKTF